MRFLKYIIGHRSVLAYENRLREEVGSEIGRHWSINSAYAATKELLYRAGLRIFLGREYWHYRKFPPDLHFDFDHRRVLMKYRSHSLRASWYSSLRGTQRGRCHVILSGPSVGVVREPRLLGGEYSIWANGSPALAEQAGITPSLYVVTDGGYIRRRRRDYVHYAGRAQGVLLNFNGASELLRHEVPAGNFYLFDDPASPWRRARPPEGPERDARLDCDENTNCIRVGLTVAVTCLQAALDLGFTEIYVFGLDLGGPARRFYREGSPEPSRLREHRQEILREMALIAARARERDVSITNCSPLSGLPETIFPRADPNEVLAAVSA